MPQPIRKISDKNVTIKKKLDKKQISKKSSIKKGKRKHPKYGTSKLEDRFAKDFLDKLGYRYERQFEAKEIGRFYDFIITADNGMNVLLEVDGDYFHSFNIKHDDKSPMQKHNEWVDKQKDYWALSHGIPLIRIWEHDINENPEKVKKLLKERLGEEYKKKEILNEKKKRRGPKSPPLGKSTLAII